MKIVSPLAVVTAVLLTVLVVGCSSGPGKAPDEEMPPDEMPATPPAIQVFSGTFEVAATGLVTGTITATITGISQDGTDLTGPELAGVIAGLGGDEQTFNYTLSADLSTITLTGGLLTALVPGGSVTATKSEPVTDPATALFGTWTYEFTDPQTMVTTTLTLATSPDGFSLTVENAPASS
jgi:hypothetical protein